MSARQHWYHCTTTWRGPRWVASRVCPRFAGYNEPRLPRLCVGASIAQCFAARLFTGEDVHVYRTETPRKSVKPFDVSDAIITRERWLVPPVPMVHVETLQRGLVDEVTADVYLRIMLMIEQNPETPPFLMPGLSIRQKIEGFSEMVQRLPSHCSTAADKRIASQALEFIALIAYEKK